MTSPLREMTAAARRMARGDYAVRVSETSRDEVGDLARAFNRTAHDLADGRPPAARARGQREPRAAHAADRARAVLENLVDGTEPADPRALRPALAQAERLGDLVTDLLDLARVDAGKAPLSPSRSRWRRCSRTRSPRRGSSAARWSTTSRSSRADLVVPRRPGPAAPAGRQPARQRVPPQPGGRRGAGDRGPRRRAAPDRGRGPGPGGRGRRPGARVRAVRDPQRDRWRRWHRTRTRHRALGHRPARRKHRGSSIPRPGSTGARVRVDLPARATRPPHPVEEKPMPAPAPAPPPPTAVPPPRWSTTCSARSGPTAASRGEWRCSWARSGSACWRRPCCPTGTPASAPSSCCWRRRRGDHGGQRAAARSGSPRPAP